MDPITKKFIDVDEAEKQNQPVPEDWPRFKIGEKININGVVFYIRKITRKDIIIRPEKGRP